MNTRRPGTTYSMTSSAVESKTTQTGIRTMQLTKTPQTSQTVAAPVPQPTVLTQIALKMAA